MTHSEVLVARAKKEPKERKFHRSTRYSGSMPDKDMPMHEQGADDCMHPMYADMGRFQRDMEFAYQYAAMLIKSGHDQSHKFLIRQLTHASLFTSCKSQRHIRKARVRADQSGALYEDWLEALFEHYKHFTNPKTEEPRIPHPKMLYSENARMYYAVYFDRFLSKTGIRYKREEIVSHYLPENYTGTPEQNRYFGHMLRDIARVADACHEPITNVITTNIKIGLMAKEFAENPVLNFECPSYKFPGGPIFYGSVPTTSDPDPLKR